jgi:hypothetical protein
MCFDLGTWADVATAIFTAGTAIAALWAGWIAKSAAQDSTKIAKQQTDALINAAKANALASRINFYSEQIAILEEKVQDAKVRGMAPMQMVVLTNELDQLKRERKHLVVWLDRQTDALGVGLGNPCVGSDYIAPQN